MTTSYKVETYSLTTKNGKHIRNATRVTRASDGARVSFIEKLPKSKAIAQAERELSRGDHE